MYVERNDIFSIRFALWNGRKPYAIHTITIGFEELDFAEKLHYLKV